MRTGARRRPHDTPIRCECGGLIRPDVVLYGEGLAALDRAFATVDDAEALLVLGSSLVVHPIAGLVPAFLDAGRPVVIVNLQPTPYGRAPGVVELHASIGATLGPLFD